MTVSVEIKWTEEIAKKFKSLSEDDLKLATEKWLLFYAPFVHEWTKPHIILPKFKKALHWVDKKTREDRFATEVHHPWYKWNPFFTNAVQQNESKILNRFYEIIRQYTND